MADHMKKFPATDDGESVEVGFNYDQPNENKEIFICSNSYLDDSFSVGVGVSVETAREIRDHLNFLLGPGPQ